MVASGARFTLEGLKVPGDLRPDDLAAIREVEVCEWYDDETERFRIEVNVRNRLWGPLFGYRGSFTADWLGAKDLVVPEHVKPVRVERRQ